MQLHAIIETDLGTAASAARTAEELGFDGVTTTETDRDPFLPLIPAADATTDLLVGTAIAVALVRSPWTLAQLSHDLQRHSGGRFVLGLGSQVQAHVERRFSAPGGQPAARMREAILAVRAIWSAWRHGTRLDFEGDFYTHTLLSPMFDPGPTGFDDPPIVLAAVGPRMTQVAAEVADAVLVHGFTTPSFIRGVVRPAIEEAAVKAGRRPGEVRIRRPVFLVTGTTEQEMAEAAVLARERLAFYGSTPNYRGVLEHHGWEDLQPELALLARERRWSEMPALIDDQVLAEFAVVAPLDQLADAIRGRYEDLVDDLSFRLPTAHHERWAEVLADLR